MKPGMPMNPGLSGSPDPAAGSPPATADDTGPEITPDMTQGYLIEIKVLSDGTFAVKQEMMETEPAAAEAAGEEAGASYDNLGDALKAVIQIVKENPVTDSEQENFNAGFGEKPAAAEPPAQEPAY